MRQALNLKLNLPKGRGGRRCAAAVCLFLFLLLQVFGASRTLHDSIHPDAASPGHQCAITLLAKGQVSVASGGLTVVLAAVALLFCPLLFDPLFIASFPRRLPPGRGPPRA
jgi:hypothetical protein